METVRCPECRGELSIDPADFGFAVSCPLCGERFTPRRPGRALTEDDDAEPYGLREDAPDRDRPAGRRRDDFEDEDDRPSRRRRRRRGPVDWEEAERLVAGPARGLILTGWIGAAFCLLGGIGLIAGGAAALDAADPELKDDGPVFLVYGILLAIVGTPYCIVLAIAGHKLKQLSGIGWAYTGAVMGIITVGLCGPCIPLTWAALPVGVWTLVTMNKREVKDAFEANREG
jgi:hypothetical protein